MLQALTTRHMKARDHFIVALKGCQIPNRYYFSSAFLQLSVGGDLEGSKLTTQSGNVLLGKQLGKGHNAVVYEITGNSDQVVKVFSDNERISEFEKMDQEIDILERIGEYAANGVAYDSVNAKERAFIVMKRIHGIHLSPAVFNQESIPQIEFEDAIKEARRKLYTELRIVHNDISLWISI
jgi:RIO-like serine/threonine protein kinase